MQTEVLIAGGGPAGLSAAIAAAKKGFRVTVVDPREAPIDKPCGEGLLPDSIAALRILNIDLESATGYRFTGIRFSDQSSSCLARFGTSWALGLRRTTLHELLAARAKSAGVLLLWGSHLAPVNSRQATIDGHRIGYRWLIGADGLNSPVRRWARLTPRFRTRGRFAFRQHFAISPWSSLVEVYWANGCEIVVTPTGDDETCVALFTRDQRLRIEQALPRFPELARRLRGVRSSSSEAGAVTALASARAVARGNVALVGDAGCIVDGIAGQGLNLAFRGAIHLGEALSRGNLQSYATAHNEIIETPKRMTRLLLMMSRYPWLRKKTLRRFAANPDLFAKLISIHSGAPEREPFGLQEICGLGWQVLLA